MQRIRAEEELEVLQPELGTRPRVYYKNLHLMTKCFVGGSVVVDVKGVEECAAGADVILKQHGTRGRHGPRQTPSVNSRSTGLEPNSGQYELEVTSAPGRYSMQFDLGEESRYLGVMKLAAAT